MFAVLADRKADGDKDSEYVSPGALEPEEFAQIFQEKAGRVSNVLLLIALIHPVIHAEAAENTQKRRWWRRNGGRFACRHTEVCD